MFKISQARKILRLRSQNDSGTIKSRHDSVTIIFQHDSVAINQLDINIKNLCN